MSAPVKYTCPDIDRIKESISDIVKQMSQTDTAERETLSDWIDTLYSIAGGRRCDLEDLRSANSSLRDWGEDLEKEVEELKDEKYQLELKVESLEQELTREEL